jgi:prepilin-type processing-associated H-X9-DG protein
MVTRRLILALTGLIFAVPAQAGCSSVTVEDLPYTVCEFDPAVSKLELFNLNRDGEPFGFFASLADELAAEGKTLTFAMNAGMFDTELRPIGLYVEDGTQSKKLNRRSGAGNFHLKPNGVFYIDDGKAAVVETELYAKLGAKPDFATQSGPMLVIDGRIHPKFSEGGISEKIRNGVGVKADGTVVFALAETPVNFHRFARLFRDEYACGNALFFDGSVSGVYSTELGRNDRLVPLGPMVGVYE